MAGAGETFETQACGLVGEPLKKEATYHST
jgi:hypothetical protein